MAAWISLGSDLAFGRHFAEAYVMLLATTIGGGVRSVGWVSVGHYRPFGAVTLIRA
jgi:hypothetical protein